MSEEYPLGEYLKRLRKENSLSMRELSRKVDDSKLATFPVSAAYYCQVENGRGINPDKITMDFFWAVSAVLGTDPLELFILSRPEIPRAALSRKFRLKHFDKLYETEETV